MSPSARASCLCFFPRCRRHHPGAVPTNAGRAHQRPSRPPSRRPGRDSCRAWVAPLRQSLARLARPPQRPGTPISYKRSTRAPSRRRCLSAGHTRSVSVLGRGNWPRALSREPLQWQLPERFPRLCPSSLSSLCEHPPRPPLPGAAPACPPRAPPSPPFSLCPLTVRGAHRHPTSTSLSPVPLPPALPRVACAWPPARRRCCGRAARDGRGGSRVGPSAPPRHPSRRSWASWRLPWRQRPLDLPALPPFPPPPRTSPPLGRAPPPPCPPPPTQ